MTVRRSEDCRLWALRPQITHAGAKFRAEGGDCSLGGRRSFLEPSAEGWGTSGGSRRGARPRREVTVNSERDYGEAGLDGRGRTQVHTGGTTWRRFWPRVNVVDSQEDCGRSQGIMRKFPATENLSDLRLQAGGARGRAQSSFYGCSPGKLRDSSEVTLWVPLSPISPLFPQPPLNAPLLSPPPPYLLPGVCEGPSTWASSAGRLGLSLSTGQFVFLFLQTD